MAKAGELAASVAERPMAAPQVAPRAPALCMVTHGLRSCVVRPRFSSIRAIYSSLNGQKGGNSEANLVQSGVLSRQRKAGPVEWA